MDAWSDERVETIVLMASSQIGKTETFLLNPLGYYISQDPAPILAIQPTLELAQALSKDRLMPMVRDTPCLHNRITSEGKARDASNRILHKTFPGGQLTMAGANSPASLAARPVRVVLMDEIDRYPISAGAEGDPVNLAKKRTTAFFNKKIGMCSTPTIKGASRIEAAYEESDQRKYWVPCPHCLEYQILEFKNLHWDTTLNERGETVEHFPETAHLVCPHCGAVIYESEKPKMLLAGEWRAGAPFKGTAGFWINELYSPWVSWAEFVDNWVKAKKMPETLKVFINTSLGETYQEKGETIEEGDLVNRREHYEAEAPEGVLVVTLSVDVQGDRLEGEFRGWGVDLETWGLSYVILHGDPSQAAVWDALAGQMERTFAHEHGIELHVACTTIDSGGHHAQQVYEFARDQQRRGKMCYPTKGSSVAGRPILSKMSKNNKLGVRMFIVGTDTAKDLIFGRLQIPDPGPGYCHFPRGEGYDEDYFKQLTAEHCVTRFTKGAARRSWEMKPGHKRNEALDVFVGNLAAVKILNPVFDVLAKKIEKASGNATETPGHGPEKNAQPAESPTTPQPQKRTARRKKKWSSAW